MTTLPAEAVDLYGLEPGGFVAARNALVKELKRGKRTEEAAAVAALRRPSVADGAINAAVRAAPQLATVWAAAVVALADEQSAAIGGAGGHLREATVALREATAPLVDAAVAAVGNEAKRGEIIGALRAASTRPGAAMVAAGILGAADPTDDLFAGAPDPPARAASATRAADDGAPDRIAGAADVVDESAADAEESERHAPQPTRQQRTAERAAARQAERAAAAAAAAERLAAAEEAASAADAALAAARAVEAEARDALRVAAAAVSEAEATARRVTSELLVARRGAGRRS